MADPNIATKAPESDVQEELTPQTSPSPVAGEHCVTDRPLPSGRAATGEIIDINGVKVYISKPSDYPHAPARLLLLLTGGTGLKSVNNQIQADKYASEGFLVAMPDLFDGDAAPNASILEEEDTGSSLLDMVRMRAVEATKSFMIDMWMARHTEEKILPILHKVVDGCKEKFADAVQHGDGIYAVGYCIGGRYILLLGSETPAPTGPVDEEAGAVRRAPLIKVGALAHAASVNPDDFKNLKVPVSLVCVENDPLFPDDVRTLGEDAMASANLEHEVKVYPGVPHGFAVVGQYDDEGIKEAQETAYDQMLRWVKEH
ncbi:uncharacterized protein DNG_00931 [Cephalotrichum gorgonifer]|uniref:Dienelactone hydrolase domain-containing protein n=1 Tax=Cephalotrichum gorgonifer TaxID=2041049 RepID=A0AAE8MQ47_9PEZI|nr:uncharacterized protein DNG_00931 [Cephalotrichum gorgonifer]